MKGAEQVGHPYGERDMLRKHDRIELRQFQPTTLATGGT